jgi:hypothetical protein
VEHSSRRVLGSLAACATGVLLSIALSLIMRQSMGEGYRISPVSVILIAFYSSPILLVFYLLGRLLRHRFSRWCWIWVAPPTLALLSLPWLEEAWISRNFSKACDDAGIKVYRQVEVEGYYDVLGLSSYDNIRRYGFSFMEHLRNSDGKVIHLERPLDMKTSMPQWKTTVLNHPTARYHVVYAYQPTRSSHDEPIGWKLFKTERRVVDSQTGEILGRYTMIKRIHPVHEALLTSLLGPPIKLCNGLPNVKPGPNYVPPLLSFPDSILKPVSNP